MPNLCTIVVTYMDGHTEEFYGGLHASKNLLQIWPKGGDAIRIPLVNIRKYETKESERNG